MTMFPELLKNHRPWVCVETRDAEYSTRSCDAPFPEGIHGRASKFVASKNKLCPTTRRRCPEDLTKSVRFYLDKVPFGYAGTAKGSWGCLLSTL